MAWQRSFSQTIADGRPYVVGDRRITPRARVMSLSFRDPHSRAAFSFSRVQPVSIAVDGPAGQQVIPIRDVTRRVVFLMVAASLALSLIVRLVLSQKRRA